jgi:uncharacterized membrane protein
LRNVPLAAGIIIAALGAVEIWASRTMVIGYLEISKFHMEPVYIGPMFVGLSLFVFLAGILLAIYGYFATPLPPRSVRYYGLKILEERYAKGEISQDEYLAKKEDMKMV